MRDTHEPREAFVSRLESEIEREARRRNRLAAAPPRWIPQSPFKAIVAVAALVLVSMAVGGGVVAAAYEAQTNEQRQLLASVYEQRAQLAQDRLALARDQMRIAERRVAVGLAGEEVVLEARVKIAEAETQLHSIRLQLEEVRITGQEPLDTIAAPLVSGRDFVTERLQAGISVPQSALALEKAHLQKAERRFEVGLADSAAVDLARARVAELQAGIAGFQAKMDIRQRFLRHEFDATMADLRVLQSEAERRHQAIGPRLQLALRDVERITSSFQKGLVQQLKVKEAELRLMQLKLDLVSVEVELSNVRLRIAQHRGK